MSFDPATLPDRQWLKLSEVVNFLALNEVQDETAMNEAGSPSDRLYSTRAEQARIRCLDETGTDPKHAPFAKVINSPGFWNIVPLAPHLDECKASWTPSGQCLFDLVVGWEHARGKEIERREEARTEVEHWFASGKVVFKGHRLDEKGQDMGLERIGVKSSEEIGVLWEGDFISATTRATTLGTTPPGTYRARRVWDRVCIKRASLVSYLSGGPGEPEVEPEENAPVEQLPVASVQIGVEDGKSSQPRIRRGAPVEYPTDEPIIADVLAVLERTPNHAVAPLITDSATNRGCFPSGGDDLYRLVDRVRRKVNKQRQRLAEQRPD